MRRRFAHLAESRSEIAILKELVAPTRLKSTRAARSLVAPLHEW